MTTIQRHQRGTLVQEETQEYLEEAKLKELVEKYSEFINFPIYLYASKEVDVPVDEAAEADADDSEEDEEEDVVDDEGADDDGKPQNSTLQYNFRHATLGTP